MTRVTITRHIAEALADARRFRAAGSLHLARLREGDAAALKAILRPQS